MSASDFNPVASSTAGLMADFITTTIDVVISALPKWYPGVAGAPRCVG